MKDYVPNDQKSLKMTFKCSWLRLAYLKYGRNLIFKVLCMHLFSSLRISELISQKA